MDLMVGKFKEQVPRAKWATIVLQHKLVQIKAAYKFVVKLFITKFSITSIYIKKLRPMQ